MGCDPDPPPRPGGIGAERAASLQRSARFLLAGGLGLLGLWILRPFLPALAWAAIFAVAVWPLYERLVRQSAGRRAPQVLAPLVASLLIGLIFIVPLLWVAVAVLRETTGIVQYLTAAQRNGIPVPQWLVQLPGLGHPLAEWWRDNLADPEAARDLLGRIYAHVPAGSARHFGGEIVHRLTLFAFTLVTLFFLFRDGTALSRQLVGLSDRLLGPGGERISRHMIAAVHGTVNGLVLVGLAEGVLLGVAYAVARLPHAVSIAALTGVLAVIPFGAPIAFGAAALYLVAVGSTVAAAAVFGFGLVVVFVADHLVRPVLIGGAARLPFLWVLLGILGGLETFGFLGLFLGPVTMAALMSLWRDWTQTLPAAGLPPPDNRPPPG